MGIASTFFVAATGFSAVGNKNCVSNQPSAAFVRNVAAPRSPSTSLSMSAGEGDTFTKLRKIIKEQLDLDDEGEIKPESTFNVDLKVDSLDLIELVIAIEDGFEIEIDDSTAGDIKTVQDVIDFIENLEK